uniref:Uncharacterized protein n=1 Tax=Anguilla anguilla TaxID=7936 RepID=A0A0E9P7R6_ANGAN
MQNALFRNSFPLYCLPIHTSQRAFLQTHT